MLKPGALWRIEDLLTKQECEKIIQRGLAADIHQTPASGDKRHRNCCTHKFEDIDLSSLLFERIKNCIPQVYKIGGDKSSPPGFFKEHSIKTEDLIGTWTPYGVNTRFSLLFYHGGGHFGPHRDAYISTNEHVRSMLTLSMYLTDRPTGSGGATHFLQDEMDIPDVDDCNRIRAPDNSIEVKVEADKAGKAIFFQHDLLHEGGALTENSPPKWLLVTQVFYKRNPESAPKLSQKQLEARELLKEAEQAESLGNISQAIKLYSKAYRLDPTLDGPQL